MYLRPFKNNCFLTKVLWLCALLMLFAEANTNAQTYFFDNYNTSDGIESSKIFSICQTTDGFIWLGTDVGVTRFDGSEFNSYTIKNGLGKGEVRVLFEDNKQRLWIGHTDGAITIFANNQFSIYSQLPIKSNITSIAQDQDRAIWVTTYQDGAFRIVESNQPGDSIQCHHYTSKDLSDMVFNSFISNDGTVYLITDIGIKQFDKQNNTFNRFAPQHLDTYFQFSVLLEDSNNHRWYGTYNGGLYKQNIDSGDITYYDTKNGLASNWITDILEDEKGNIWISHWDLELRGGLTRISPNGSMQVFDNKNGLHDNKIWSIYEDVEGNILIGTTEHGLDIFKGEKFISYNKADGIINNQVHAIYQDMDYNYWFGTNGGISILNTSTNSVKSFNQQSNQISNQIRFIKADNDNNIWIGTEDQGVQFYDVTEKRFVSKPEINSKLPRVSKSIWGLEVDKNNNLWIGTLAGIIKYDINARTYIKTYAQIDGLPSNETNTLFCSSKGRLWVGSKGGLSHLKNDRFQSLTFEDKIAPSSITQNSKEQLIIGTEAHGVYIIDNDQISKHYDINDGLFTNNIRSLVVDNLDNIYAGTAIGLNKIIADKNIIVPYSSRDGFVGIESKPNAAYKDATGKLWLGTVNGVSCYNPLLDMKPPALPIAHITEMHVNGERINITNDLEFTYDRNNFKFHYNSISTSQPTSVKYEIKLEGSDSDWQKVGKMKNINYGLPPGQYNFMIKAINSHGISPDKPTSVSFTILAPIYKRPWFIAIAIVLSVIIILTLVKLRERNLIIEKRILAEKVDERTQELSQANTQLADRNKDITDSIHYARRIQFAILPADIPFNHTFIFFQPKDIVSGDFYWANSHMGKEFLAVVDCTGHGVPGAFMSFIGHTSLNKIIIENGISKPSEILNQLNKEVSDNLHQKDDDDAVNDGMDLSLICYDPKTRVLEYAGAYNPLWIIRDNELLETKANRFSIGRSYDQIKEFTNHQIAIQPNDCIYLFTDGYADQFGGPNGKKFKGAALKKLLLKNHQLNPKEQHMALYKNLLSWKGDLEQIDDILVVGRCFS